MSRTLNWRGALWAGGGLLFGLAFWTVLASAGELFGDDPTDWFVVARNLGWVVAVFAGLAIGIRVLRFVLETVLLGIERKFIPPWTFAALFWVGVLYAFFSRE